MTFLLSGSIAPLRPPTTAPPALRETAVRLDRAGLDLLIVDSPADALIAASWLIPVTWQIGLVCRIGVAQSQPFHTARALAAMDTLSRGRMGWWPHMADREDAPRSDRTTAPGAGAGAAAARLAEYIAAAQALWDSWDEDALIIDKASGVYLDSAKVRRVDFRGQHYRVLGPLNAARPPQGHPVLVREDDGAERSGVEAAGDLSIVGASEISEARRRLVSLRAAGTARLLVRVRSVSGTPPRAQSALAQRGFSHEHPDSNARHPAAFEGPGEPAAFAAQLESWQRELGCDGFHLDCDRGPEEQVSWIESVLASRQRMHAACATLRTRLGLSHPINPYTSP